VSGAWNRSPGFFDACSILLKDESLRQLLAKRIKISTVREKNNQHEEIFCAVVCGGNVVTDVCGKRQSGS
jgi:hypothetical protein